LNYGAKSQKTVQPCTQKSKNGTVRRRKVENLKERAPRNPKTVQQDPEKLRISGARSPEAVKGTDKRQNAQNPQDQAPEGLKRPVEPDAEN
jgi:hypothetical protein